jgi:hypothetical protein
VNNQNLIKSDYLFMPKLYFCFPSKQAGGMSLLFMRVAEYLSTTNKAQTYLIDYEDGFMSSNRDKSLTNFLAYSDENTISVPDDGILILQAMTPWSIFPGLQIDPNVKIVFWNCYPFGLVPILPGVRTLMKSNTMVAALILNTILYGYKRKMRDFTSLLMRLNGIIFQDTAGLDITQKYLSMNINQAIFLNIPALPAKKVKLSPQQRIETEKIIKVSWVGRIVDMKYFILKYTLGKLNSIQEDLEIKIEVRIVGQGDFLTKLEQDSLDFKNLSIIFIDHLSPVELDKFLLDDTDILLAMGTSALEGAKLGIPTLLLDVSYKEVDDGYVYTWLHERKNAPIAEILNEDNLEIGNQTLKIKIGEAMSGYSQISKSESEHFIKNHSLSTISDSFLQYCLETELSWKILVEEKLVGRGLLYKTFNFLRGKF